MRYSYKKLYEKNAEVLSASPRLLKACLWGNKLLTALFFAAYLAFFVFAVCDRFDYADLMRLLGAPALCFFLVFVLRLAVDRPRPYSEAGANITPFLRKKSKDKQSFPSRHVACAFVIAVTLFPYCAPLSILLIICACALAYIRFALGLHYPSDLIGGAILGTICGLLAVIF